MKLHQVRALAHFARQGMAAFCLGLFLLVQAMAASPVLHHFIHQDAGDKDHRCAVTLFTRGQACFSETHVEPVVGSPLFAPREPVAAETFLSVNFRDLPCRGPPA